MLWRNTGEMDSNSTISVGLSFFTTFGGGLLGIAQLGTAIVLAIFTIKLYQATAKYADLVDSQNAIMEDQNKKVESQNLIMKSQNQLMSENRDHKILVMKYNRMLDEMNNLVAPLYARRNDPQIFIPKKYDKAIKRRDETLVQPPVQTRVYRGKTIRPIVSNQTSTGEGEIHREFFHREFYVFWNNIFQNLYLNQSAELQSIFDEYLGSIDALDKFEKKHGKSRNEFGVYPPTKDLLKKFQVMLRDYESNKQRLVNIIELRYLELKEQISEIETELKISGSFQQARNPNNEDL